MTGGWLACPEEALPEGTGWLTEHERSYADRQRFTKRRSEFLVARYTAKTALAHALGLPGGTEHLGRIGIAHEPSGAPYVVVDGSPADVRMSLTDRAGWAVCLVSHASGRVGCDLELVEPRSSGFVADWFTASERHYVHLAPDADARDLAANLIWSAKESALKVLTTGLRLDTRSVEVRVGTGPGDWQPLTVTYSDNTVFPGWWRRLGSFVLTIATQSPADPPAAMPGPWDLAGAAPNHSWLASPVTAG